MMATINIARAHALPKDEARKRAGQVAATISEEFGLASHWEGDALHFAGESGVAKGTTGQVRVGDGEVRVVIDLPFMLGVLKGKIERKVAESLQAALSAEQTGGPAMATVPSSSAAPEEPT